MQLCFLYLETVMTRMGLKEVESVVVKMIAIPYVGSLDYLNICGMSSTYLISLAYPEIYQSV